MRTSAIIVIVWGLFILGSCRKSDYIVEPGAVTLKDSGNGTGTVTWTKDTKYVLEGLVFVNDGQTLTIKPGTVVRFRPGQAENSSALIVARGGKIIAEGTREEPIIFTVEGDDLNGSIPLEARGLWGGLIMLGNAPLNVEGGESVIEGIPFSEPRIVFGGSSENDNSGTLKYVSIRHGGTNIGDGNEINGLTLGGVGSGTTIDYVEVISNEDDGVEIFGGNVNLKHLIVAYCGDDAFDYDLGWSGNGQFWLGIQSPYLGDKLIEAGGGTNPIDGLPNSLPNIYNATLYAKGNNSSNPLIAFDNNAGGTIANSIILNNNKGITIQETDQQHDSFHQWEAGNLAVKNNLFHQVASNVALEIFKISGVSTGQHKTDWASYFLQAQNQVLDPQLTNYMADFRPKSKLNIPLATYPDNWFQQVTFAGAFGEDNWLESWSLLSSVE
ncbi:MAG: hypothetical protein A2066_19205 [Bacteroidetes bacterium GWB2_41_8]|nr:MAG: hypothetical protein A2066_19205 [Bacteroidetes bacterium GWB2_41_8]